MLKRFNNSLKSSLLLTFSSLTSKNINNQILG